MKNTSLNNSIIIVLAVVILLSLAYFLSSKNKDSSGLPQTSSAYELSIPSFLLSRNKDSNELTQLLSTSELVIPSFDWFDDTYTPVIRNKKELSKVWQSRPRCCEDKSELQRYNREFYKGCYVAILKFPNDDDIEANCLWLMDIALESREERLTHNEHFIKKFFYYERSTNNCFNCAPANISSRVAQTLAYQYNSADRFNDAVKLLERMSDERKQETSDWVLAELSTQLGKYYLDPKYRGNSFQRITENYQTLKPDRNNEVLGMRFGKPGLFDKLENVYFKLLEKQKLTKLALDPTH